VRDLSLHILDLVENSIRAEASIIAVTVDQQPDRDLLRIIIEDNGPGLNVPPDKAVDPFYTTKSGKRTGLGLSLFKATAELAGGTLTLSQSPLGGLAVEATMQLRHIDRLPLGDLSASLFSVALTNPHIDFWCRLIAGSTDREIRLSEMSDELPEGKRSAFAKAKLFASKISESLAAMSQ